MKRYISSALLLLLLALLFVSTRNTHAESYRAPVPTAVATSVEATPDPEAALPPPRPEEEIPYCEWAEPEEEGELVEITAEMAAIDGPIDYGAPAACRVRSERVPGSRVSHPYSEPSIPNPEATAAPSEDSGEDGGEDVDAASTNAYKGSRWAVYRLNCPTCNTGSNANITSVYWFASAARALFYNAPIYQYPPFASAQRVHAGARNNIWHVCSDGFTVPPNVSFGHAQQYYQTGGTYRVFYEIFAPADPDCDLNITNIGINPDVVMYYNIYTYMSGSTIHYVGRMWVNGAWSQVFDTPMPHGIGSLDAGWELSIPEGGLIDADYSDNIELPVNFMEKFRVTYSSSIYPLDRGMLPTAIDDIYLPTPEPPLEMIDLYDPTNIFSDLSVKAN